MTPTTQLLRQVHPKFLPDGELSSQAFYPFPNHKGKLSVYDGDQVGARESYEHYTRTLNNESIGVWAVTCAEVMTVGLAAIADPLENFESHAAIDFGQRNEKECRKLAKKLKAIAVQRGQCYAP